jgi:hypothetical protein
VHESEDLHNHLGVQTGVMEIDEDRPQVTVDRGVAKQGDQRWGA